MLKALDHIIIAVKNLEEAEQRWEMLLGRKASWAGVHPDQGTANRLFRFGDFYLELMASSDTNAKTGTHAARLHVFLEKNGEGIFGVCFAVDHAERCAQFLEQHGMTSVSVETGEGQSLDGKKRQWRLAMPALSELGGLLMFMIEHQSDPELLPLSPAEPAAVEDLDHFVIMTSEAEKMKNLLNQIMGIRLALDQNVPEWKARQLFFRLSGKTIEVVQPSGKQAVEQLDGKTNHFWGLAWQVKDVAATHRRLTELQAFNISPVRTGRKQGTLVFTVRDAPSKIPTLVIGPE